MATMPPPLTGLTPHITIADNRAAEAIDFYTRGFAATELARQLEPDGTRLFYAHLEINGASLMLNDHFPEMMGGAASPAPAGTTLHLAVDDADAWFARAIAAGATERFPLADQFWGDRYGQVTDPFGHVWSIGSPISG